MIFPLFIACKSKEKSALTSEKLIAELVSRYPSLLLDYTGASDSFKLQRKISDNIWNAEFELYKAKKANTGVLIIKKGFQSYVIPLFSEWQADYWKMKDSVNYKSIKTPVNVTFEQELKKANKLLQLSKTDIFLFRYLFKYVMLREETTIYPDPCDISIKIDFKKPLITEYDGDPIIVLNFYSRDSLTLTARSLIRVD